MGKHLDIHQEGVKATCTTVQGSWDHCNNSKKYGQYGDRTRDIRVISTTL